MRSGDPLGYPNSEARASAQSVISAESVIYGSNVLCTNGRFVLRAATLGLIAALLSRCVAGPDELSWNLREVGGAVVMNPAANVLPVCVMGLQATAGQMNFKPRIHDVI
jgi:hypothetical protein